MCLFNSKTGALSGLPATTPRVDNDTALPTTKQVVDPDKTADVAYGTGKKKPGPAAGQKTGTDSLKIALNTGGATGSSTGGMNV